MLFANVQIWIGGPEALGVKFLEPLAGQFEAALAVGLFAVVHKLKGIALERLRQVRGQATFYRHKLKAGQDFPPKPGDQVRARERFSGVACYGFVVLFFSTPGAAMGGNTPSSSSFFESMSTLTPFAGTGSLRDHSTPCTTKRRYSGNCQLL